MVRNSHLAKKMSEMSGQSINADNAFSAYDTNGDGSLSKSELDSFMKANAPQPPQDMSGMDGGLGQTSSNSMKQALDNLFSKINSDTSAELTRRNLRPLRVICSILRTHLFCIRIIFRILFLGRLSFGDDIVFYAHLCIFDGMSSFIFYCNNKIVLTSDSRRLVLAGFAFSI